MSSKKIRYAQIQYHGEPGITRPCLDAIVRLIYFGDRINKARLLSSNHEHCFLLTINSDEQVAIKSGFSSGYAGEGPRGLAVALQLLERHGADIEEYEVSKTVIEQIDDSCLRNSELDEILEKRPVRPSRWFDYVSAIEEKDSSNNPRLSNEFPIVIPFAIIDHRILDLALEFPKNPDGSIVSAFRRLEDTIRSRAGLSGEVGARLFAKTFQSDKPLLHWVDIDPTEQKGRANLFSAVYMAYRNPRAHKEVGVNVEQAFREFLLLNELFLLEAESQLAPPFEGPVKGDEGIND